MIQVLSADWCGVCKTVKQFLTANNIPFQERNIDQDTAAYDLMMRLNLRSIPVTYLDDDNYVLGLDRDKLLALAKK